MNDKEINFKIFIENIEVTDKETITKLIKPLDIREDYKSILKKINYVVKISSYDLFQYKVEYFTYNKLLHYKRISKIDIQHIIRENFLNKILNE